MGIKAIQDDNEIWIFMELSLEIAVPITKSLFLEPLSETITMFKVRISQIQNSKSNVFADPMLAAQHPCWRGENQFPSIPATCTPLSSPTTTTTISSLSIIEDRISYIASKKLRYMTCVLQNLAYPIKRTQTRHCNYTMRAHQHMMQGSPSAITAKAAFFCQIWA